MIVNGGGASERHNRRTAPDVLPGELRYHASYIRAYVGGTRSPSPGLARHVSVLRVLHLPEFYFGDDAVVAAFDDAGLGVLVAALEQAHVHGASQIEHPGHAHHFLVQASAADLELRADRVRWRLDRATITEMIDKLAALKHGTSGHHYVDIDTPAKTLVLSLNEYLDTSWINTPTVNL